MNAAEMLHLTNKLDMILSEVDEVKELLIRLQMDKYEMSKAIGHETSATEEE